MSNIDPTKFHVEASHPAHHEQEHSFQELMAEQLRHAPWLMLSLVTLTALSLAASPSAQAQAPAPKPPGQTCGPGKEINRDLS